jgi:hypothetical protein
MRISDDPTESARVIDFGDGSFSIAESIKPAHEARSPESKPPTAKVTSIVTTIVVVVTSAGDARAQHRLPLPCG